MFTHTIVATDRSANGRCEASSRTQVVLSGLDEPSLAALAARAAHHAIEEMKKGNL